MGSLYNASFTGTPLILTAGQQEQGHGLTEPVLYGPLVQMAYVVAPAGVPAPVREKLIAIFGKAIQSAEFRKLADDNGFVVDNLTGAALGKVIDDVQAS